MFTEVLGGTEELLDLSLFRNSNVSDKLLLMRTQGLKMGSQRLTSVAYSYISETTIDQTFVANCASTSANKH